MTESFLDSHEQILIKEFTNTLEQVTQVEQPNRYEIIGSDNKVLGYIYEKGGGIFGFLQRFFLKGVRRPLEANFYDTNSRKVLKLKRRFAFFLPTMKIYGAENQLIGQVSKKFSLFSKKYNLKNSYDQNFASINSSALKIWEFPLYNNNKQKIGNINKKWRGVFKETIDTANHFSVEFIGEQWSSEQRAIFLCAALSIDLDYFKND